MSIHTLDIDKMWDLEAAEQDATTIEPELGEFFDGRGKATVNPPGAAEMGGLAAPRVRVLQPTRTWPAGRESGAMEALHATS
jgi:hypothetical protein